MYYSFNLFKTLEKTCLSEAVTCVLLATELNM